jgi:uncharacterized protein (DUF433 family)
MSSAAEGVRSHIDDTGACPVVAGTDIKVSQIASEYEHMGMTPDEIAEAHPHLGLAEVHAALAYYYDHKDLIRREWAETEALISELRGRYPGRTAGREQRASQEASTFRSAQTDQGRSGTSGQGRSVPLLGRGTRS